MAGIEPALANAQGLQTQLLQKFGEHKRPVFSKSTSQRKRWRMRSGGFSQCSKCAECADLPLVSVHCCAQQVCEHCSFERGLISCVRQVARFLMTGPAIASVIPNRVQGETEHAGEQAARIQRPG